MLPVCKLGVPGHGETAFGALAPANGAVVRVLNRDLVDRLLAVGVSRSALEEVESTERAELLRRAGAYPGPRLPLGGRNVIAPSVRCGTTTSSGCWMPGPPEHQRGVTPRPS
ncbi:hypothetical protein [Arthrobacter sp. TB 26]|uniref:hypothetical protein n=1 Tax=Arthrobacter sp. TB 26 TaxID=494420 RepID=UPI0003F58BD3|nr:hypothetical protein [Arthrobacter sp. TB 26]